MININRLKSIKALAGGQWAEGEALREQVPGELTEKLIAFTEQYPEKAEGLRDALADADKQQAARQMQAICDMLSSVGAAALADGCKEKLPDIQSMTAAGLEAYAEGFLSAASALCVDILMAIYSSGPAVAPRSADGVADETQPLGAPRPADGQPGTHPQGGRVILAVDDNSFFLNTLKSYLQDTQYKLTCVTSGSMALRYLEKHTPGLCIFDIEMPEMNGYELADKVRQSGVGAPIIFLTGNASKEYVIKAVEAGASDFIIKPISKDQALEKISRYI